jgi:hypothetical protein
MEFEIHRTNPFKLRELRAELNHRTRRRSLQLRDRIDTVLNKLTTLDSFPTQRPASAVSQQIEKQREINRLPSLDSPKPTQPSPLLQSPPTPPVEPASKSDPSKLVEDRHGWTVAISVIAAILVLVIAVLASGNKSKTVENGSTRVASASLVSSRSASGSNGSSGVESRTWASEQTSLTNRGTSGSIVSAHPTTNETPSEIERAQKPNRSASNPPFQLPDGTALSYETYIPRPTLKGYYEPRVIPYPTGKPVYVNGYYRKNGTYVSPHFRSLPRR